jgi:hypothetical protein
MPKIHTILIRPADTNYGQDREFDMFSFLSNEFNNQGIQAQLSEAPFDAVLKMNKQGDKLDNLRAAAIKVVGAIEEGSSGLAAAVRELDAAVKDSQR